MIEEFFENEKSEGDLGGERKNKEKVKLPTSFFSGQLPLGQSILHLLQLRSFEDVLALQYSEHLY